MERVVVMDMAITMPNIWWMVFRASSLPASLVMGVVDVADVSVVQAPKLHLGMATGGTMAPQGLTSTGCLGYC